MERPAITSSAPLLPLTAAFIAGDLAACLLTDYIFYGVAILAALCFICALKGWRRIASASLFAALGMFVVLIYAPRPLPAKIINRESSFTGVALTVKPGGASQRIVAECRGANWHGKMLIHYKSTFPAVEPGDSIRFRAVTGQPGAGAIVPHERTSARYAMLNGISGESVAEEGALEIVGICPMNFWNRLRYRQISSRLSDYISYGLGLDAPTAAMLEAVLLGNADAISDDVRRKFSDSGTAHALALSGTHVSVIVLLISLLMFPVRLMSSGRNRVAMILMTALLWLYVLLTGCGAPVVRSALMVSAVMMSYIMRRGRDALNNLCLAALVILLFSPVSIFDTGFQLSFCAVAAIVLFMPELQLRGRHNALTRGAVAWLTVCLTAVAGTFMTAAWYFHQIPLYFLAGNVAVSLLLPLFMGCGILLMLVKAVALPAGALVWVLNMLYAAMEGSLEFVASLPGASLRGVYFSVLLLVPYYGALWCGWMALRRRRAVWWSSAGGLLLFTAAIYFVNTYRPWQSVPTEAYSLRDSYSTILLLRDGSRAIVLTDTPDKFLPEMEERLSARLADWMGYRGVDSLEVHRSGETPLYVKGKFYADSVHWVAGDMRITLLNNNGSLPRVAQHPRYLLLCRGYRGKNLEEDCRAVAPDTVVISRSLHVTKREEFAYRLHAAGIPFREGLDGVTLIP